ncbi:MAG: DEAD/DEAH box helicase, partial [Vicinamibacterales bacterium]
MIRSTVFPDCEAIDLARARDADTRTLLVPFDRPRRSPPPRLKVVSRRRWAHEVRELVEVMYPYGGLRFCPQGIRLMAYQLEPALAMLRHGVTRVLVADDVGLGKTIEAGLVIRELALGCPLARTLVLCPAALRPQWMRELATQFDLRVVDADAAWLREAARTLPPDVNPWSLPGVYLASMDLIKRPEALHPLEDVRWDLLVVDEAHAAAPGTHRRAAIHALACRAAQVMLLTATPHSGSDAQFASLCSLGSPPTAAPIVLFNRSRAEAALGAAPVRSTVLAVSLSPAELAMHRLLEAYTARVWTESRRRQDAAGELVATLLRKRALSSAASLAISARRRLALMARAAPIPSQLLLPLDEEDVPQDEQPEGVLGARGLNDADADRRALSAIADAADAAAGAEAKVLALVRLLRRAREPAIVFSEYRDTAGRLAACLADAGHRVWLLHGGLTAMERERAIGAFTTGSSLLVATDAASEGLNLHHTCRLVIHFELPWTPSRLEQRCGRVNRIGQSRRVHEIALVGRHTSEQLVLVPLLLRAARARGFARTSLMDHLSESRLAGHVLAGAPLESPALDSASATTSLPGTLDLRDEARMEVRRLELVRRLAVNRLSIRPRHSRRIVSIACEARAGRLSESAAIVLDVQLHTTGGELVERLATVVSFEIAGARWPRQASRLQEQVERLLP